MADTRLRPRPLTVKQLLATGALGDCHVVAGEQGLDRVVSDVYVTAHCDLATPISTGLLVVLDARELRPNSYALDVALRTVRDGDGSGLVAVNAVSATGIATRPWLIASAPRWWRQKQPMCSRWLPRRASWCCSPRCTRRP